MSTNFQDTRCNTRFRATWLMISFLTLLMCGEYSSIEAQETKPKYDELSIPSALDVRGKTKTQLPEVTSRIRDLHGEVNKILSGEAPLAGSEARFDAYFQRYVLPQWTFVERIENTEKNDKNEAVANFNFFYQQRKTYASLYIMKCRDLSTVHAHLVKITLERLTEIAKSSPETVTEDGGKKEVPKNLHPAVRYFAMLFIAELNEKELVTTGNAAPPVPLAAAVPVMVAALKDPQQLDAVKVAALMGVIRYLDWESRQTLANAAASLIANQKPEIDKFAIELINAKDPPDGRSLDGHAWMQRRALEVLSLMGTLETDVNLAPTVESIVSDANSPVSLRCSAAEALGQLDKPKTTKLILPETTKKLGELAVFVCQRELKRLDDEKLFYEEKKEWQRVAVGAGGGQGAGDGRLQGFEGGQMPMGMNPAAKTQPATEEYKRTLTQRRIKTQMHSIAIGLQGIEGKSTGIVGMVNASNNPAAAEFAKNITEEVTSLRDVNDQNIDLEALVKQLRIHSDKLDKLTKSPPNANPPPAAAAAAVGDVPGEAAAAPAKAPAANAKPAASDVPE